MADVSANLVNVYEEGLGQKIVLYRVRNVDSGDTVDVSGEFRSVQVAPFTNSRLNTTADGSIAGTVITLTLASTADDVIYLLVQGQAAV